MREEKRLIRNTAIIAIGNLSTRLVSFLLLPLYTSILSTSEYGMIDYVISISTFCVPIVSLLMDESVFRFLIDCKTDEERKKVISITTKNVLIGCLVFIAIAIPVLLFFRFEYSIELILYILAFTISMMLSAILRGQGRTDLFAVFNFISGVSNVVLNVLFIAVFKFGVRGMLYAYIISQIGISIVFIIRNGIIKQIDLTARDIRLNKEIIKYSLPLIPNKISWAIINLSDRIMVMNMIGSSASGLYAISYKFPSLMDTLYGFFQAWKESSARALEGSDVKAFYQKIYTYLRRLMIAVVLCFTSFMPLIYRLMINEAYYKSLDYVPILLLATFFSNMSGFFGGIFTAYKDTKVMGTTTAVAAIINIVINFAFIPRIGVWAAAISTLVANIFGYVYRVYASRKYMIVKETALQLVLQGVSIIIVFIMFYRKSTLSYLTGAIYALIVSSIINRNAISLFLRILHDKVKLRGTSKK